MMFFPLSLQHSFSGLSRLFCGGLIFAAIAIISTPLAYAADAPKAKSLPQSAVTAPPYKAAIVIDAASGAVLFEHAADRISPPASITKLMTFLLVHDAIERGQLRLDSSIRITAASANIGGTQVWLREGEVFPVEELLYALMLHSANDCAHALALAVGDSIEEFSKMMNARAAKLGLTLTRFHNPHGLPPSGATKSNIAAGNLSTARNIATLSRYLVTHTDVLNYSSTQQRSFRASDPKRLVAMRNHNHLLGKVAGVDGLKTGYTRAAGFCLAATAERSGQRIIAVILGAPTSKTRDLATVELLERGFAALTNGDALNAQAAETAHDAEGQIRFTIPAPH